MATYHFQSLAAIAQHFRRLSDNEQGSLLARTKIDKARSEARAATWRNAAQLVDAAEIDNLKSQATQQQFARMLVNVKGAVQAGNGNGPQRTLGDVARALYPEWAVIIDAVLSTGFAEVDAWCEEKLVVKGEANRGA